MSAAAAAGPTARAVPTPFDAPDGATTVATPSCCSCCCCLVSISTATAYSAASAQAIARRHHNPVWLPLLLGLAAVPAGVVMAGAFSGNGVAAILAGLMVVSILVIGARLAAGDRPRRAILDGMAIALITLSAFVVELPAVMFTLFLIEFAAPFGVWRAIVVARRLGPPPALPPPSPPPPPPPSPPPPAGAPW